jgi:hypothetical protein
VEQRDGSPHACVELVCREFIKAKTPMEILSAINDVDPAAAPDHAAMQRPRESGGVLSRT